MDTVGIEPYGGEDVVVLPLGGFVSYFISSVKWAKICIEAGMKESRRAGLSTSGGEAVCDMHACENRKAYVNII